MHADKDAEAEMCMACRLALTLAWHCVAAHKVIDAGVAEAGRCRRCSAIAAHDLHPKLTESCNSTDKNDNFYRKTHLSIERESCN